MARKGSCYLFVLSLVVSGAIAQRQLPKYNVDRSKISVSGISSGACMATQVHVAYSSLFMGAGIFAGTPYFCAYGSAIIATGSCSSYPDNVIISDLVLQTNRYANSGDVDPTGNMRDDKIFIFAGNQDSVVATGIGNKVQEYYGTYVIGTNIKLVNMNAEHTFPTQNSGNACSYKGSPYIGQCGYDGAYEVLNHIYGGGLTRPTGTVPLNGDYYLFDQSEFFYISPPALSSMDTAGYIYVPSGCMLNQHSCKLHVAFHGCQQGRDTIGDTFASNTGYNQVGELNDIIILYPQAIAALGLGNPLGCWDWWGYTIPGYATKGANQPLAVYRMVDRLS